MLGHIAHRGDYASAFRRLDRAEHDVYGKLRAVLPLGVQFQTGAHLSQSWFNHKALLMSHMTLPEPRRHQHLDSVTYKLFGGVTEHRPGLFIDPYNTSAFIDDDDGVRSKAEEDSQRFIELA